MNELFEIVIKVVALLSERQVGPEFQLALTGWDDLLVMIAVWLISAALTPKPKVPEPVAFEDWEFPKADEGTPQAVFFGDVWTSGWMVLEYGNYRVEAMEAEGGK